MTSYLKNKSEYDCSGCGACSVRCPKQCIRMVKQQDRFLYPEIDTSRCISCHLCEQVCPYENGAPLKQPAKTYAAVSKNAPDVANSSSGGLFSLIAGAVLDGGGVVYGAALDENLVCRHIRADNRADLKHLQKSKYVQSVSYDVYPEIIEMLKDGRKVLFSGTACQVAGLKNLAKGIDERLFTIDVACHGVPSQDNFHSYIQYLEKKHGGPVCAVDFRYKTPGRWGHYFAYEIEREDRQQFQCAPYKSPYYYLFLHGFIFRKSCYRCIYAQMERVGDLTLADFWGLQQEDVPFDISNGVSAVAVNTEKGKALLGQICENADLKEIDRELLAQFNQPFREPCREPACRDELVKKIISEGYTDSREYMSSSTYFKESLKAMIPGSVKTRIRRMASKEKR